MDNASQRTDTQPMDVTKWAEENRPASDTPGIEVHCLVHGYISLSGVVLDIYRNFRFQRLRFMKQLQNCRFRFNGATHDRLSHSVGVYHVANRMLDTLVRRGAEVTEEERLRVSIAALLHDVGHMPLCHLMDKFLHFHRHDPHLAVIPSTEHETRSGVILHKINIDLGLPLDHESVVHIIHMIKGTLPHEGCAKPFLYQIVANHAGPENPDRQDGLDADRIDYLVRDAKHTGQPDFQWEYLLRHLALDEHHNLTTDIKGVKPFKYMLDTREYMFNEVYKHHRILRIDQLIYEHLEKHVADIPWKNWDTTLTDDYILTHIATHDPERWKAILAA